MSELLICIVAIPVLSLAIGYAMGRNQSPPDFDYTPEETEQEK